MTMRGEGFAISLFGLEIPGYITWLFQGLTEGGVHGIMGYLFLDMYLKHNREHKFKSLLILFSGILILIFVFAIIVGFLAKDQPITSVRPIFTPISILYPIVIIAITLVLAKFKGGDKIFRYLGIYLLGTLVYVVVNLETMHVLGVRYIGILLANGDIIVAEPFYQVVIMFYSDLIETTVSRGHYFIIPLILGFVKLDKLGVSK